MLFIELVLFCALFTLLVRFSAINGAINALYFYPISFQEIAYERGLADKEDIKKKRKRFMIPFVLIVFLSLLLIVGVWNKANNFKDAYLQSLLFLEVMTWYDGVVIDRLWVGHGKLWKISGMEGIPYVQTWKQVFNKRIKLTVIWIVLAIIPAEIICIL